MVSKLGIFKLPIKKTCDEIATRYMDIYDVCVCVCLEDGQVEHSCCCKNKNCKTCEAEVRSEAICESLRWGQPTISELSGRFFWAVPIMYNAKVLGGLVACVDGIKLFSEDEKTHGFDIRSAMHDLQKFAEDANITNAAVMNLHRNEDYTERKKAEAIHDLKEVGSSSALELYLRKESELVSAIRKDDRAEAIGLINSVLLSVYRYSNGRIDLTKSLLMELVITMCRTAVDSGDAPQELLGTNYATLTKLSKIETEEGLSEWVVNMLNAIFDSILTNQEDPNETFLAQGLEYMKTHYASPLSRDDVAGVAFMSVSHFSRQLKEKTGQNFTDTLNNIRIENACKLLRQSNRSILQIALDVGFNDQSYFTKVFRKHINSTPKEYKERYEK